MKFGFCLLWLQVVRLLLILTLIAAAEAQLPTNTTRTKKFQCLRVSNVKDWNHVVLGENESEDSKLCAGIQRPTWPNDLTEFFVHWECRALKKGMRTEPQFVYELTETKRTSTNNTKITWQNLKVECGCDLTLYSLRYLSKETSSHNKWHFSTKEISVGVSCGNRDSEQCKKTLLQVKREWSWVWCNLVDRWMWHWTPKSRVAII